VYEFINEEFLEAFCDYLTQRIEELREIKDDFVQIVEIGAGNGRLSHFIRQRLGERVLEKVKIMAVDSGTWNIKPSFPVDQVDHKTALEKYKPHIVIFSWMPYKEDFTADFRAFESVEEYLLIGETDEGCCGDEWKTWGHTWGFGEDQHEGEVAPYLSEGFARQNLDSISEHQICRTDSPGDYRHSQTVSFRRKR
jgi:hypothetical protein